MRSLFLRIFLSLGSALILIFAAVFVAASRSGTMPLTLPLLARSFLADEIRASGASALALYVSGGIQPLITYFAEQGRANGTQGWLINEQGSDVTGKTLPPGVAKLWREAKNSRTPVLEANGFAMNAAVPVESAGKRWIVVFLRDGRRFTRPQIKIPGIGLRYIAGLLAALLFSYVLSRLIANPIRQLRSSMREYAAERQPAPLPKTLRDRRDELGDLAREFDQMRHRVESLLETQRQLLADVSHELRSPLTRMSVAVEIALDSKDREPDLLERIAAEAEALERLIQQILWLARLEGKEIQYTVRTISLTELLPDIIENAEFEAGTQGKSIEYCGCDGPLLVRGDASLLASAFENILRNAIRYTPTGSSVAVTAATAADLREVEVTFRDRGTGVPPAALEHIFRPFYRVDSARDRDSGGAGLGLSIAYRSISICGGKVQAFNHPEGGLEVTVRLPCA